MANNNKRPAEFPQKAGIQIKAVLNDGTTLVFPRGTSQDVIDRTVKRHVLESLRTVPNVVDPLSQPNPVEGMRSTERFAAGAGQSVIGGLRQLGGALGLVKPSTVAEGEKLDAPLLQTSEGSAGRLTGTFGQAALMPVRGPLSAIGGGAVMGAEQPATSGQERLENVLVGAGAGLVGAGAGKVAALPFTQGKARMRNLDDFNRAKSIAFLQEQGVPVSYAEKVGTKGAKNLERMLHNLPGSAGWYDDLRSGQQIGINNIILGMTGGNVGKQFQEFGKGKVVTLDDQFFSDLANIKSQFGALADIDMPNSALKAVGAYTGKEAPNPVLEGFSESAKQQLVKKGIPETIATKEALFKKGQVLPFSGELGDFNNAYALRSLYANRAWNSSDPADQAAYKAMTNAFDALFERQFPNEAAKLKAMQGSYLIDQMLRKSKDELGDYSLPKVASAVRNKDADTEAILNKLGPRGETLRDLSRSAEFIAPSKSSGTAENILWQRIATLGLLSGGAGGGYMAGGLPGAAAGAASLYGGLYAAPWMVNKAVQSRLKGNPSVAGFFGRIVPKPFLGTPELRRLEKEK